VEKITTLAKKGGVTARRRVFGMLDNSRKETDILFSNVVKALINKNSGFTRLVSLPRRHGDNAQIVRLEWTEKVEYIDNTKKVEAKKEKKVVKKVEKKEVKKKEGK
jgi:large subunit ribosomal protein L17